MPSEKFKQVSWSSMFKEGEKRIRDKLLQKLVKTNPREHPFLLAKRIHVRKQMEKALQKKNKTQLFNAFKEQTRFLSLIEENV